jgi:CubicO group peptidase (beta-lactamase class C family)
MEECLKPIDDRLLLDAAAYIDRWVGYRQRTLDVPGIAIAVAHRGRVVLSRAYGLADVERGAALTTDHVFRVASHSKMFTATAVMQLVEQGRLSLDERAGDRLAWLPAGPGQAGRATVRQLLSHSAGLIRDGEDGGFWQVERDFPSADELRETLVATPLVVLPNERFKYSNIGYGLLGLLIEAATGEPYNAYVRRSVVDRLGLRSTGPELDEAALERLATGYSGRHYGLPRLPFAHQDTGALSPATGFWSTAEDLCRFAAGHFLGNEELLSDESKREMQHEHWSVEGASASYGLGLDVMTAGGRRVVGHAGGFPGFITNTKFDPVEQLVVVALTSAAAGPAQDLVTGMLGLIERALRASPASEAAAAELDRFTGRFWSYAGATDVLRFGDQLLALGPEQANPVEPMVELAVEGPDELRIAKAPGYASPGERVRYTFAGDGSVERVRWAASTQYPWETFSSRLLPALRETRRGPGRAPVAPAAE